MESTDVVHTGGSGTNETPPVSDAYAVLFLFGLFVVAMTPLTLLPLMLTDSFGRRRVGWAAALSPLAVAVAALIALFTTPNRDSFAEYVKLCFLQMQHIYAVAKHLPGNIVVWVDSGEGLRYILKGLFGLAFCGLLTGWFLPYLQEVISSVYAQFKRADTQSVQQSFSPEDVTMIRQRQQEELNRKAEHLNEVLRHRRLAHIEEQE